MAINVEVKQDKVEVVDEYPKLMVGMYGVIVQFQSDSEGQVVGFIEGSSSAHKQGYYSDTWTMDDFTDFHGTVTLSNK